MNESLCRTCRWWRKGLKKGLKGSGSGSCKNPDLLLYLTDEHSGFSPPESFSCARYERSVEWARDAAEEIDDWYQGLYTMLPEEPEERIEKFAEIILRHLDTQGAHASRATSVAAT